MSQVPDWLTDDDIIPTPPNEIVPGDMVLGSSYVMTVKKVFPQDGRTAIIFEENDVPFIVPNDIRMKKIRRELDNGPNAA